MFPILDVEEYEGYPSLSLGGREEGCGCGASSCSRCEGFRPAPKLDGSLEVDPEIHLPSPGLDVDIAITL